jgi:hypothetical protein
METKAVYSNHYSYIVLYYLNTKLTLLKNFQIFFNPTKLITFMIFFHHKSSLWLYFLQLF